MIILKKDNVERIVPDMPAAKKLVEEGYIVLNAPDVQKKSTAGAELNLDEMTTDQLRQTAKDKGIKGVSSLKKDELLAAIRKAD